MLLQHYLCRSKKQSVSLLDSNSDIAATSISFSAKVKGVLALTKARLNLSVVYSALAGYFLGAESFNGWQITYLCLGGYLVVGAANGFNQCIERDRDALMDRTKNRPLPTGTLSFMEAMLASTVMAMVGMYMLLLINPLTAAFGALALFLYVLAYTPLKSVGPVAVFVGAIPGAIPALLGWVAATNDFDIEPGTLFALQFIWQFAHFWAIAWIVDDDYKKAGYVLLPSRKRDTKSARQILLYTLFTIPVSLLPFFGLTGTLTLSWVGMTLILLLGIWFLSKAIRLYRTHDIKDARKLMLSSVAYLPLVQLIYVVDKFL
jgi:protoheme IX farnesyltransferase